MRVIFAFKFCMSQDMSGVQGMERMRVGSMKSYVITKQLVANGVHGQIPSPN